MNLKAYLPWALGALLLLLLGAYVYATLESEEVTVYLPGSAEARRNPLLAVQRLLQRLDQPVESVAGSKPLFELPPDGDLLLLYRSRTPLNAQRRQALLDWVRGGGRLVMDVAQLYDDNTEDVRSPLLDALQVGVFESEDVDDSEPAEVKFNGDPQPVEVMFRRQYRLYDRADRSLSGVSDDSGYLLLQLDLGQGMVTLVNDLEFIDNEHIDDAGHGFFARQLLSGDYKVWLLYDPSVPGLLELIVRQAWPLLLSLAALGVLWLWHGNRRLGPVRQDAPAAQRDLFEHLDAQGGFDWRQGLGVERLRQTRRAVLQRWLSRFPVLSHLDDVARAEWIAQHSGHPPDKVRQALFEDFADQPDFIRRTRLLQALWQQR